MRIPVETLFDVEMRFDIEMSFAEGPTTALQGDPV